MGETFAFAIILLVFSANLALAQTFGGMKDYVKSELECDHDKFEYAFKPDDEHKDSISKITMIDNFCQMRINPESEEYRITVLHNQCGTTVHEERDFIVFKNVAQVYYINKTISNDMIIRPKVLNIGLECRMLKSSVQTLKVGKKDAPGSIVVGPQHIEVNDYARANGSFRIDFQVYKSLRYNFSYRSEDFPIHISMKNRIYFEITLDKQNLRIVPQSCYATKTKNYLDSTRYYLIKDRCPKDITFSQHKYNSNTYRFSIQAFGFKDNQDSIYVHCHTYVCQNETNEMCSFGCQNPNTIKRSRRSIGNEHNEVDGFMTSTLEIKITEEGKDNNLQVHSRVDEIGPDLLIYLQIPFVILIAGIILIAWKCVQARKSHGSEFVNEDESNLTAHF